jgi:hypothetical protein
LHEPQAVKKQVLTPEQGVLIPSGEVVRSGAKFFGRYEDGSPFSGEFFSLIGRGYTTVDGYGFINAEAAVKAVRKK